MRPTRGVSWLAAFGGIALFVMFLRTSFWDQGRFGQVQQDVLARTTAIPAMSRVSTRPPEKTEMRSTELLTGPEQAEYAYARQRVGVPFHSGIRLSTCANGFWRGSAGSHR